MEKSSRIYVAGGDTLIGAALRERLRADGFTHLVGEPPCEPDLTCAQQVEDFFAAERPEYVFLVAGPSGGIRANLAYPARLMRDNLLAATHVLHAAYQHGVAKLLYLASSCSYPRLAPQPMPVEALMTGRLEPTNEAYAMAKLAGLVLCQAYRRQYGAPFITAIPANAFGPYDDFSPEDSHVIPGLLRKLHEARCRGDAEVQIWGSGRPRREFIYSRDMADACLFLLSNYGADEPINIGGGQDLSIAETARAVAEVVGYRGQLSFDTSRPDGMPLKSLDCEPLKKLGWTPPTPFHTALAETYAWFLHSLVPQENSMLERLYKALYRIRLLEEELARVYPTDKIKSPIHLSIGQEAVSVGVCEALRAEDVVFGTYRGHALYLAKGGDMKAMVAELYGKATGCAGGKGGSMHLISTETGMMGASAVVGTTIANAAGYAYAFQQQGSDNLVVSFFGDGATEEGVFAESLNFAALKHLPLLFVCENNGYAIHTSQQRRQGKPDICARARAYGIPAERIEHNDVLDLLERTKTAVAKIRAGDGPYFLEVMTYRWREHVGPNNDFRLGYRTEDEATPWMEADQVTRLEPMLSPEQRERIEEEVEAEVEAALLFAEESPEPEGAELYTDVV